MIEVEKKFNLNEENEKRIIADARFLKEIKFRDLYYDSADYKWTKADIWLRTREGKFELKVAAVAKENNQETNFYEELGSEDEIRKRLGVEGNGALSADLVKAGFVKIIDCTTVRRKYQKGEFIIDMDSVTYADTDWDFRIGEIELLVKTKDEMAQAFKKIAKFAKARGLEVTPTRGKALEYLMRESPEHYQVLMKAWAVR